MTYQVEYKMYQYVSRKPDAWADELVFVTRSFVEQIGAPPTLLRVGTDTPEAAVEVWRAEFPKSNVDIDERGCMRGCFWLCVPHTHRTKDAVPPPMTPEERKEMEETAARNRARRGAATHTAAVGGTARIVQQKLLRH